MGSKPVIAVVGGGISGLSTAFYLRNFIGKSRKIVVIEKSKDVGGWLKTYRHEDGHVHELGPRSIRFAGKLGMNTLRLIERLGMYEEVIGIPSFTPAAKKRMICIDDQLHYLPNRFLDIFFKKPPFSKPLAMSLLKDLRTPMVPVEDISVFDFVESRCGEEVAKYLIDPLCRGITAGDAKKLSMIALFPEIFKTALENGSLVKGMLKPTVNSSEDIKEILESKLIKAARNRRWSIFSLRNGLESLTERLAVNLIENDPVVDIHNESEVTKMDFLPESVKLSIKTPDEDVTLDAEHVFSTITSQDLARTLDPSLASMKETLSSISSVNVAVVLLEYKGKLLPADKGFGFLTPSWQKHSILGVTFDSLVFPQHTINFEDKTFMDITQLTCMMGGEWFEDLFGPVSEVNKEDLVNVAIESVQKYLGFKEKPIFSHVAVHKNCIPQYHLGHRKKVDSLENTIKEKRLQLTLLGTSYKGVSVNESIYNAREEVKKFVMS